MSNPLKVIIVKTKQILYNIQVNTESGTFNKNLYAKNLTVPSLSPIFFINKDSKSTTEFLSHVLKPIKHIFYKEYP